MNTLYFVSNSSQNQVVSCLVQTTREVVIHPNEEVEIDSIAWPMVLDSLDIRDVNTNTPVQIYSLKYLAPKNNNNVPPITYYHMESERRESDSLNDMGERRINQRFISTLHEPEIGEEYEFITNNDHGFNGKLLDIKNNEFIIEEQEGNLTVIQAKNVKHYVPKKKKN